MARIPCLLAILLSPARPRPSGRQWRFRTTATSERKAVASMARIFSLVAILLLCGSALAQRQPLEISDDDHEAVVVTPSPTDGLVLVRTDEVPYGTAPDWQNSLRRQVGGLQVADLNGDGWNDVVVGCYISNSYPPYTDWENLIYFNTGGQLEANPSWVSADEVSTGDIQVAFINADPYPDVFAANGGASMSASVIYFGGPGGPSTTPGWYSAVPGAAWNNYALPFDLDHDGDVDVITANQGNSPSDPYRPIFVFFNNGGTLANVPGWQSAETSIQNFLAMGDYDRDGWEDLAVSKWANFASGIYANRGGQLETTPIWTTGDTDTDKGVAWADVDGDQWPDLALGHDPTQLWGNDHGALSVVWSAQAPYFGHSDVAFCDVDRDGDQDLAEDHFSNGQVRIYLNRDGVLDSAPSWIYDSPTVGTALAFGDLNGDQWPDLVVGNSGEPCVKVFYAVPSTTPVPADAAPRAVVLHGAAPNPFNPRTTVAFTLTTPSAVTLRLHDAAGRLVRDLASGEAWPAGRHEVVWDGRDDRGREAPSGLYLAQLEAAGTALICKLLLAR